MSQRSPEFPRQRDARSARLWTSLGLALAAAAPVGAGAILATVSDLGPDLGNFTMLATAAAMSFLLGFAVGWLATARIESTWDERNRHALAQMSAALAELEQERDRLAASEEKLRLVTDNIPVLINYLDPEFRFLFVNRPYLELFGVEREAVLGRTLAEVAGAESQEVAAGFQARLRAGESVRHERHRRYRDGKLRTFDVRLVPHFDPRGNFLGHFSLIDDVTEHRANLAELAASANRLKLLADNVPAMIGHVDREGRLLFANRRCREFYDTENDAAVSLASVVGREFSSLYEAHHAALLSGQTVTYDHEALSRGDRVFLEVRLVPHCDGNGAVESIYMLLHDVTSRKLAQRVLEQQALTDVLTGLPNMRLLTDRLDRAIAQAERDAGRLSLLFVDLDGFKSVNDRWGHAAGDGLLRQVAERLLSCLRNADTLARVGGDEFVVLLHCGDTPMHAEMVAEKVVEAVRSPFILAEGEVRVTCSVGLSRYPADGHDAEILLRHADRAMYRAKHGGKDRFESV